MNKQLIIIRYWPFCTIWDIEKSLGWNWHICLDICAVIYIRIFMAEFILFYTSKTELFDYFLPKSTTKGRDANLSPPTPVSPLHTQRLTI